MTPTFQVCKFDLSRTHSSFVALSSHHSKSPPPSLNHVSVSTFTLSSIFQLVTSSSSKMRSSVITLNLLFSLSALLLVLACQDVAGFVSVTTLIRRVAIPSTTLSHLQAASSAVNEGELSCHNRGDDECNLAYRIVRPMALSSRKAAPNHHDHGSHHLSTSANSSNTNQETTIAPTK